MSDALLKLITSDAVINGLGMLLGLGLTWLAAKKGIDISKVKAGAGLAYEAVNLLKDKTSTKIDDKASVGLKALSEHLGRPLSTSEVSSALNYFEARHAEEANRQELAAALLDKALAVELAEKVVPIK